MHRNAVPQLIAGGNISPSTFVKVSTAANNTCLQAGDNERVVGVSQVGAKDPPGVSGASAYAAVSGDTVQLFGEGDVCLVLVGSGGVTRGALVKSTSAGAAVLAATTGTTLQWVAGEALSTASEGEYVRIQVKVFPYYPALA